MNQTINIPLPHSSYLNPFGSQWQTGHDARCVVQNEWYRMTLGSTSWVTDTGGNAVQHLHYLPMLKSCAFFPPWHSAEQTSLLCAHCLRRFGETFINQKTTTFAARYTFSGKEKDVETGYGYFGARYYSSDLSIWLSVDPMSDKYPNMSPYVYCADNPVMLVDPDGRNAIGHDPPTSYTIRQGDTFWALEQANGLPYGTLSRINPNVDPNNLQIGQVINFAYMLGNLVVIGNNVPTIPLPDYYSQPTSSGPTMNLDNYNTLSPFLTLWNVAGLFVGIGSQYEFRGTPKKTFPSYGRPYPGNDPTKAPKGYVWKGQQNSAQGSKRGSYINPKTNEVLRPDLQHRPPINPHWDYRDPNKIWYRLYPNGSWKTK